MGLRLRRRLTDFLIGTLKKVSNSKPGDIKEVKILAFVDGIMIIGFRPFQKLRGLNWRLTKDRVEEVYDREGGISIDFRYFGNSQAEVFYYDGKDIKKTPRYEFDRMRMEEYYKILEKYPFESILEVGAGELTVVKSLVERFGKDVKYYACDLSFNRIYQGKKDFEERMGFCPVICKANAASLPYPDNSFDVVYTSHCLEQMPYDYKAAIDEMCRVAKKAVILLEPTYKMGDIYQKLSILKKDYVRGIGDYLKEIKGVKALEPFLLTRSFLFNRTGCYIAEIEDKSQSNEFFHACPACKQKLEAQDTNLYCSSCQKVYFTYNNIPILDSKYSFYIGNKYKS